MKILSSTDIGHLVKGLMLQGEIQGRVWFLMVTSGVHLADLTGVPCLLSLSENTGKRGEMRQDENTHKMGNPELD